MSLHTKVIEFCTVPLIILGYEYKNSRLLVLSDLCADAILGHDILSKHASTLANTVAYALSRICSALGGMNKLSELHDKLCRPGITRIGNDPEICHTYSVGDVRKVISSFSTGTELKPNFCKYQGTLVKVTALLERLNIDFKCQYHQYPRIVIFLQL
ncbi:hypothetical protein JTB14_012583 [Gonioctena quinquepunctata]|nr:hypothetical protein JTB14_012583 [Gonioctena quinquepunctata]